MNFIQPEITKIGGLTAARKVSVLAELNNIAICPHCFCLGPVMHANLHWLFSTPGMDWMEVPFVVDRFAFPSGVSRPELHEGLVLPPPDRPGLGCSL